MNPTAIDAVAADDAAIRDAASPSSGLALGFDPEADTMMMPSSRYAEVHCVPTSTNPGVVAWYIYLNPTTWVPMARAPFNGTVSWTPTSLTIPDDALHGGAIPTANVIANYLNATITSAGSASGAVAHCYSAYRSDSAYFCRVRNSSGESILGLYQVDSSTGAVSAGAGGQTAGQSHGAPGPPGTTGASGQSRTATTAPEASHSSSSTTPTINHECGQVPTYSAAPEARVASENVPCGVALQIATTFYKGQAQVSPNSFGQYVIQGYDCASSVHDLVLQCESGGDAVYAAPAAFWSKPIWLSIR